ncbi:histidine phosphatase family protein [Candidatus Woesearchaeota archaeon]|nr:histidine phosphatase family protein [Candidatus Woesearchaeota archaeon]
MAYRTVYVFRHGESYDNIDHIFSGWRDSKLAPKGVKSAKLLARKLRNKRIDLAFSSDQTRALQTLDEVLRFHKGIPVVIDARLRERDYGALTGKSKDAFEKQNPRLYMIYHRSYTRSPPKGESFKDVNERVKPFIHDLIKLMKSFKVNVAISAHGNSIRPMRKHFEHLSIAQMRSLENAHDRYWAYRIKV